MSERTPDRVRDASGPRSKISRFLSGGGQIAVAMAVMNFATYGYTILVAHTVGPASYGAFLATMNVLIIVSVASLGVQATAARRIAADPQHVGQIERSILRVTYRAASALGLLLLLLSPVVDRTLRLDNLPIALLVAASAVPVTIMGAQAGILQGERRWRALGLVYVAAGVPRLVAGAAVLAWRPTEFWAIVAVFVGFCAPVVVGWWALRHPQRRESYSEEHRGRAILWESVHNGQALLAYFALTSVDIIVARNVLSDHDSGLYAAGLILTKAMLFLPQFVVVVAFPSMSTAEHRRRALAASLSLVVLLGLAGALATWLLSSLAMVFVGGDEYIEIEAGLWVFALLGTVLSMVQLLIYSVLARQGRRSVLIVWAGLVLIVGLGLLAGSITALVVTVLAVDVVVLAALLLVSAVILKRDDAPSSEGAVPLQ